MNIIEAKNITKYFGGLCALKQIDVVIKEGEILGLIGPNGAGKTTFFNLISGTYTPSSGQIYYKQRNITGLKPYQINRLGIARTFQQVRIFPDMTALENITLATTYGRQRKISKQKAIEESKKLLSFVGLIEKQNVKAEDLTLCEQKKIEIARALGTRPDLLLLDEAMAGLNNVEVREAMNLILNIKNNGITICLVEHVMSAVMGLSDRIIVFHHGEKIADGKPEQIATNRRVIEVYLGE